ncbi:hypothetical protein U1Q18_027293 [Sarracenia purpurea var. burkii]
MHFCNEFYFSLAHDLFIDHISGLAVVELEFHHPDNVNKAEKSWKVIANSLQSILSCNVEIRINLVHCAPVTKHAKKKPSFSLFRYSGRHDSRSTTKNESDPSYNPDIITERSILRDKCVETCSSYCGSQFLHNCGQRKEGASTLRNNEGNALSIGMTIPHRFLPDHNSRFPSPALEVDCLKEERRSCKCQAISAQEVGTQPGCFSRILKLRKKMQSSSDTCQSTRAMFQPQSNLAFSIPRKPSAEAYFCSNDCQINCSRDMDGPWEDSKTHCWSTPMFPFRKAWQLRHQQQRARLPWWILPCVAAAK